LFYNIGPWSSASSACLPHQPVCLISLPASLAHLHDLKSLLALFVTVTNALVFDEVDYL